ncbi:hypothetical protein GCM10010211_07790 [Streptomyces albospinus]|uniref:Uncharacterized protein n=1 Tax=Streptomyces albospinus TaxID=285515 RepID=A0ABQ2UP62_9ACTN|nr:hypothetical protein GCM10010211_07790 [Streptomyces albospinus]
MGADRFRPFSRFSRSTPPPLPTSPSFWRSPLRGPRLTALLGVVLLAGITLLFVTGLLSYAAYNPDLAGGVNDKTPTRGCWASISSAGRQVRTGCTGSPRVCTSRSAWCWCRCCWRSCGR